MAFVDDVVTFEQYCCFGDICGKKLKRLGCFGTIEEARQDLLRHLIASPYHSMSPSEAKRHVQRYTEIGCEDCCVMQSSQGPVARTVAKTVAWIPARWRSGSRDRLFNQQAGTDVLDSAIVLEPTWSVVETATVVTESIQTLSDIVDSLGMRAGRTSLQEVQHLLDNFQDIRDVVSAQVDQLRAVVIHMRTFKN
jgi:hypothetical protein